MQSTAKTSLHHENMFHNFLTHKVALIKVVFERGLPHHKLGSGGVNPGGLGGETPNV
jgi:hypothetical protein